jgi:calcineurin-like phosphoesterase
MIMTMRRSLLIPIFLGLMLLGVSASAHASDYEVAQTEQQIEDDISVSVSGQTVSVCGAQGATLEVVSLTGRKVMAVKIDSPAQRVELNIPKGCYILKIGKVVRKISVR